MDTRNYALGGHGLSAGVAGAAAGAAPPEVPALEGFRRQIDRIHGFLTEAHEMADRSCGVRGPVTQLEGNKPDISPNGMLDHVQADLLGLEAMAFELVGRLRRVAG